MYVKKELTTLSLIDSSHYASSYYASSSSPQQDILFWEGQTAPARVSNKVFNRVMVPIHVDDEIDLNWLHEIASSCGREQKQCYACIYSIESIVYELVETSMR
jgi:hypothetical protein